MKLKSTVILAFATVSLAFGKGPGEGKDFKVDNTTSKVTWVGKKVTGEHTGGIRISDGKLNVNGNKISGGKFDIDMTSITCTDITDAEYNGKLVGHLKSDDFFSSAKFPKASFVITKAVPAGKGKYDITGNLTIKGITKEIKFPATVQLNQGLVSAKAVIKVDRTLYDIKYGSGSFFDNLGDKAIDNIFELNVDLVAKN
jgi:polyisoprenoid-binding protein YceI